MTSNWLGLPYPPGRHLRCDPYRESLGSLRAYYYKPHIITIPQSSCSLRMPKARGGMLRIVSKILESRKDKGDKSAATPFDSRNRVIRAKKGLSTPNKSPTCSLLLLFIFTQQTATQLVVDRHGRRGKNYIKNKVAPLRKLLRSSISEVSVAQPTWEQPKRGFKHREVPRIILYRAQKKTSQSKCIR